jgi:hypothetical protein
MNYASFSFLPDMFSSFSRSRVLLSVFPSGSRQSKSPVTYQPFCFHGIEYTNPPLYQMSLFTWRWRLGILRNRVKLKCQGLRLIRYFRPKTWYTFQCSLINYLCFQARFWVLMAVNMKPTLVLNVTPYSQVDSNRHFRENSAFIFSVEKWLIRRFFLPYISILQLRYTDLFKLHSNVYVV